MITSSLPLSYLLFPTLLTYLFLTPAEKLMEGSYAPNPLNIPEISLIHTIDFQGHPAPSSEAFEKALAGHTTFTQIQPYQPYLTIIDFSLPSTDKRLWLIDLDNNKLLFHTWVAHGRNSGINYAHKFSNTVNSYESSLGFYRTGTTYIGKHGLSLKLHGLEKGINDKAEERAIVMHGATYVSEKFVQQTGRLGRSHGCPAIPMELHKELIPLLANGALLFIYYPDTDYFEKSAVFAPSETAISE